MELQIESIIEIFSDDIVGGQLDSHGEPIKQEKNPSSVVCGCILQDLNKKLN